MERDEAGTQIFQALVNFNSHAHVERDSSAVVASVGSVISTHTLTWSVTHIGDNTAPYHIHFNSHAHVERDKDGREARREGHISTHTLTWSVTGLPMPLSQNQEFQLTRSRGA